MITRISRIVRRTGWEDLVLALTVGGLAVADYTVADGKIAHLADLPLCGAVASGCAAALLVASARWITGETS